MRAGDKTSTGDNCSSAQVSNWALGVTMKHLTSAWLTGCPAARLLGSRNANALAKVKVRVGVENVAPIANWQRQNSKMFRMQLMNNA